MRRLLAFLIALAALPLLGGEHLPQAVTFRNKPAFEALVARAMKENWRALPMGQRVATFGRAMVGTPYVGFTLEIDDHIESPSCNFSGLDCWTFFETALGLARMIETPKPAYTPSDLLREIETTRYWSGRCTGRYLERIHFLASWFIDNEKRGNVTNITKAVGPTVKLNDRQCDEMTVLWKSYRYLRSDPSLLPDMARIQAKESALTVPYIPKAKVKAIEKNIQSGDIIGIVTDQTGGHCSHVGLAYRTADGVCHLMHASSKKKKVIIDESISDYLDSISHDAGIIVARPLAKR
jgi:Protein of unknown function (DUF1460)